MKDVAEIQFGWGSERYYARWITHDPTATLSDLSLFLKQNVKEMQGVSLSPSGPQDQMAYNMMNMIYDTVLSQKSFIDRFKRHYRLFKDKINEMNYEPED